MKPSFYLLSAMLCALTEFITPSTAFADNYNLGTYNIMIHDPADQTKVGDRNWYNRKEYVAKTITDNDLDIVGLQEVEIETQRKDLIGLLPDYEIITTEAIGYEVGIAFKKTKFTLLDHGCFYLSTQTDIPKNDWDAGLPRATAWVKLKDNASNKIFCFFSTHLDTKGKIARREGTRINMEKINEISDGYPAFLVGDMNCKASEKAVHYQIKSYMKDSYLVSSVAPEGPEGTQNGEWDPDGNAKKRIDFIYVKNADVQSYKVINEDYNRGIMPSDHCCVKAVVTPKDRYIPHSIYVSTNGDDTHVGTRESPLRSIVKAVEMAQTLDTIRVAEGVYLAESTANSYITLEKAIAIIGGYNSEFNEITGYSTLTGDYKQNDVYDENGKVISGYEDNAFNLIYVQYPYCLTLSNFILSNGYVSKSSNKSAALYNSGCGLYLDNIVFANNHSAESGGALRALGRLKMKNCTFKHNQAVNGGAVDIKSPNWGQIDIINCTFAYNQAKSGSAVTLTECDGCYVYGNSFYDNISTGIGCFAINNTSSSKYTFVNNTMANNINTVSQPLDNDTINGGSAIYFKSGSEAFLLLINNTITGNRNINIPTGAALQLCSGWTYMYNNIVAGNYSSEHKFYDIYDSGNHLRTNNYNVFTSPDNINVTVGKTNIISPNPNTGMTQIANMLDGVLNDGIFSANLTDNGNTPTVKVIHPEFGGTPINILTPKLMNEVFMISVIDLDGGQNLYTVLKYDQCGKERNSNGKSTIGAFEYFDQSSVSVFTVADESSQDFYYNHFIYYQNTDTGSDYYIRNLSGMTVKAGKIEGTKIDIGDLQSGIYIFSRISNSGINTFKFQIH